MTEQNASPLPEEPKRIFGTFDELLKRPERLAQRAREGKASFRTTVWLIAGGVLVFGLYGAVAGLFQGGSQVFVSALKSPLIVLLSLILCLPSLYILVALAGNGFSGASFRAVVAGFAGVLALLLVALLPIAWLFSVSSRSLPFVIWLHVIIWLIAVLFAHRFVVRSMGGRGAGGSIFLWVLLFIFVSFQVTTYLRPVLWRRSGAPLFEGEKMFFMEHLSHAYDSPAKTATQPTAGREGDK
jgi:hypothetical protein